MSSRVLLNRIVSVNKRALCSSTFSKVSLTSTPSFTHANKLFSKKISTSSTSISGLEATQVIQKSNLAVREIVLNRPKKFNALTNDIVRDITSGLQAWEKSELAKIVLIKHTNGKAFCAGGDVKIVSDLLEKDISEASKIFGNQYTLDHLVGTLETPYVAVINGITMGAGLGISVHGPFRIATENTVVATPETALGLAPDAGATFFLSRLDGQLGIYLGLTGKQLNGVDVFYSGLATHYIPSSRLADLESRLAELDNPTHDMINQAIEEYSLELETEPAFSLSGSIRQSIDRCFRYDTVEEIVQALEKEEQTEWTEETLKSLSSKSPTALKVTLQAIRNANVLSFAQCLKMEYHLTQKFIEAHDFKEGVDATLVRRSKANFNPAQLKDVNITQIKQDYFNSPSPLRLELLNKRDYKQYPHRKYMLPSEKEIMRVVTGEASDVRNHALTRQQIVDHFLRERQGKQGLKQKVLEVLDRKTIQVKKDSQKSLKWVYEI